MSGGEERGKRIKEEGKEEEREEKDIKRVFLGIMEGYRDDVIPPLSDFSPRGGGAASVFNSGSISSGRKRESSRSDESLRKERFRREKMNESYILLQSMVPSLFCLKASRETILTDTIEYIERLEEERKRLEDLKKSLKSAEPVEATPILSFCTNRRSTVNVTFSGGVAFFGVESEFRRHMATQIIRVFEEHQAQVLAASVAVHDGHLTVTITALIGSNGDETAQKIKREILIL